MTVYITENRISAIRGQPPHFGPERSFVHPGCILQSNFMAESMHIPHATQVGFCNNQTCDTCCWPVFKALALKKNQLTRKGLVQTRALKHLIV